MFKSGEKIVYLKNKLDIKNHNCYYEKHQLKDLYNIKKYYIFDKYNQFSVDLIYLIDYPIGYSFDPKDFINLNEYRKQKINKICSK